MRLLHTSDWHLGQALHNYDRAHEHERFLEWLLDTIEEQAVDALLVAGDIFDNANPSAASQRQFYRFLQQAKQRAPQLNIVIIAGNHDSPGRLEAPRPLLEGMKITIVGHVSRLPDGTIDHTQLLVPLVRPDGSVGAWCLAVPFLRPGDVPRVESDGDPYMDGVALLYRQVLDGALGRREDGQAIIALGHCHMTGGEVSADSERRIVVGGAEALSARMFDAPVAYAALGHLHKAQRVAGCEHVRYCGSPIPMSFAEVDYAHQVLCIDLNGDSVAAIREIRVPRSVELLRIPRHPGTIDEALAALHALDIPPLPEIHRHAYLEVRVRLDGPEPGLRAKVEAALEGKPVRLAKIDTSTARRVAEHAEPIPVDDLDTLQPDEIFKRLYQARYGSEVSPDQLAAFTELLLAADRQPS
ncbi:exonuclease SbcCD subunit D C-terminal domain-containing protein [Noviherbaspirillum saxi]|uniref:Nuclease SbcCD subunit D n=1 Tax=Noviherbaspirillum saxi TaxID=2320863 RepID=A0A3A3FLK9_9BURK|nr:exonuclease SbcCD subunit D C-terminal domain-containing protein [Noviherbaspirillum saxi]RJF96064.1 exonuclease subunit SbcD [Noviherbaspirillum saxi]